MLDDIERGHITGLIFSKLARLARNTRELLDFADTFREYDADLISLGESIDTSTPAGRLFFTMLAAMATWEREEIAERVAASVPVRAKLGKNLGGQASFGYRWENQELVLDPQEAPIRKRLYELFLEHRRMKTVARLMNEEGYRTRRGAKFSDTTVERLLRDPTAKGERRANYTKSTGQNRAWELKPEDEWVTTPAPAIVSEEVWEACNTIIDEQKKKRSTRGRKPIHLFTGLTYCTCGHKMYVPSNTPKYVCYDCRNKIPVADLEAVFHQQLQNLFTSDELLSEYLNNADTTLNEMNARLASLEEDRERVHKEMDKLYDLYMADGMTKDGFGKRYKALEERQSALDRQIPTLQAERDFLNVQYFSSDQVIADAKDLYAKWDGLAHDDKRRVVEAITERIEIGAGEISITFCHMPTVPQNQIHVPHQTDSTSIQTDGGKATPPHGFIAASS